MKRGSAFGRKLSHLKLSMTLRSLTLNRLENFSSVIWGESQYLLLFWGIKHSEKKSRNVYINIHSLLFLDMNVMWWSCGILRNHNWCNLFHQLLLMRLEFGLRCGYKVFIGNLKYFNKSISFLAFFIFLIILIIFWNNKFKVSYICRLFLPLQDLMDRILIYTLIQEVVHYKITSFLAQIML